MSLVSFLGLKPKTPRVKTLGVLLFGVQALFVVSAVAGDCMPAGAGEWAQLERVYDGDTFKLKDGRHIRVLGVNTPEVDHGKQQSGQALGEQSRWATNAFLSASKSLRLFYDVQRVDRYGRTLAHVYDAKGNSLTAHLLRNGLGFHAAIPPNLSLNQCLVAQEAIARKKNLGVWGHSHWRAKPAVSLGLDDTGFQRVRGRVVHVRKEQSIWLELDGPITIKITPTDLKSFPSTQWDTWQGRHVEVRGWVTARSDKKGKSTAKLSSKSFIKPLIIQPRIATSLELLN